MNNTVTLFRSGQSVKREIEELHQFFQDWFNGNVPNDIGRMEVVLAPKFLIITPSGQKTTRKEILDTVSLGYGSQNSREIWVDEILCRNVGDLVLATYVELQVEGNKRSKRLSTALFSYDADLPNRARWEHVHETWI